MKNILNPNRYNSLKHGVSSRHGLLPWENAKDYAALEAQWRRELRPHGTLLEDRFISIVRNRWQHKRNSQAAALFVACHPFGRAVAEAAGEGDWVETARKLLSDVNAQLKTFVQFAGALRRRLPTFENAAEKKQLIKEAAKCANAAQRIADRHDMAMEFSLGLGDEIRKQADRDTELDGKFNKLLTGYFQFEQMLATRVKLVPHVSHHASAEDLGGFDDELPEKSEPKGGHPIPGKIALPEPAKEVSDDGDWDWDTPPKKD